MTPPASAALPWFLQSFENMTQHFEEQFRELEGVERGGRFVQFACKLLPLLESLRDFPNIQLAEKQSHDGGVDILSNENDSQLALRAQSKFKIRSRDDFDQILSKFQNYDRQSLKTADRPLIPDDNPKMTRFTYAVISSSKLENILASYRSSAVSSRPFFDTLVRDHRFILIDGPTILEELQGLYCKTHIVPATLDLSSAAGWLERDNVRIGVVPGSSLVDLYKRHGDSLFFENIRDFLGVTSGKKAVESRETVNAEIIRTVGESPGRFLERNNGVTFRARKIIGREDNTIHLEGAGIINGCQTTMCLVEAEPVSPDCSIVVKVVETSDAWDIAKSSNHQNPVSLIDLDLARFFRPQIVTKAATDLGYGIASDEQSDVGRVLNEIYESAVDYDEMKCTYLGLFSRKPNNIFEGNYTELRVGILRALYSQEGEGDELFQTLFLLVKESRRHLEYCSEKFRDEAYANLFKRFFNEEKPKYRSLVTILAVCGLVGDDISTRSSDDASETERMRAFLRSARREVESNSGRFKECYVLAFAVLADASLDASTEGSDREISQKMYSKVSGIPFNNLFAKLKLRMDSSRALGDINS
jgi:hypothetical protein